MNRVFMAVAMLILGISHRQALALPLLGIVGVPEPTTSVAADPPPAGVDLSRLEVPSAAALATVLSRFLGAEIDQALLKNLREAITAHCLEVGRPFVDVSIPEQDVTDGVLRVVVAEYRVGRVSVAGNRWFSDRYLLAGAALQPGQGIDKPALDQRITRLNSGPYLTVEPGFQAGEAPGTTDVVLHAADRIPLIASLGFANTGSPVTGWERWIIGAGWGNVLGRGHTVSWQFSSSTDLWNRRTGADGQTQEPGFAGHNATWQIPLPDDQAIILSGGYALQSPRIGPDLNSLGRNVNAAGQYVLRQLPWRLGVGQEFAIGYEYKTTNNNLAFGGVSVQRSFSEISQFTLRYSTSLPTAFGDTQILGNLALSPGGMLPDNTDQAFQPSGTDQGGTPGAKARYLYGRMTVSHLMPLGREVGLVLRATGQLASGNLLPSEQLAIAGVDSVRGYQEFGVSGSQGFLLTTELRSPRFRLLPTLSARLPEDSAQLHLFADYGRAGNPVVSEATPARVTTASIGMGLRYEMGRQVALRLEQGWQLVRAPNQGADGAFLHAAVSLAW